LQYRSPSLFIDTQVLFSSFVTNNFSPIATLLSLSS
jgi:hypothetical protein